MNKETAVIPITVINVLNSSYLAAKRGLIKKLTEIAKIGAILRTNPFS